MYLLGYDIGSSSIKAALVDVKSGKAIAITQSPASEMKMYAAESGWAEQDPALWWEHVQRATKMLLEQHPDAADKIKGIGIAYQMHGLVLVDENQNLLRPAIIWCDSRAVEIGHKAFKEMGEVNCLTQLLNSPGNFTASKLKWVKDNEPEIYKRIHKIMLPGDYIAMKLTGEILTTISGLSEGMFWDFKNETLSKNLLDYYGIDENLIPEFRNTFSSQGKVRTSAADYLGLTPGIPVAYRAGDQANNALALNVFNPGEVAATGGTSGVVYGVVDKAVYDLQSRVNGFAHVNHTQSEKRIGILLCINGAGIQYSWLKHQVAANEMTYEEMEKLAANVPVGSDGLRVVTFGNGAERVLANEEVGAQIKNLNFNLHSQAHLFRAGLEGIAFSFVYGMRLMQKMGLNLSIIRVGNDNLFQSKIFSETIATLVNSKIEVQRTTGAIGAAKGAGVATKIYPNLKTAMGTNEVVKTYLPLDNKKSYELAYAAWESDLNLLLKENKSSRGI